MVENEMDSIAESYVKLVLNVGQYDPDYVDAYYGPEEWKPQQKINENDSAGIQYLFDWSDKLLDSLDLIGDKDAGQLEILRYRYLYKQLLAVKARLFMLADGEFTFDEEAKALYDAVPPNHSAEHFQKILDSLDSALPGEGNIQQRYNAFRDQFIIPKEKLDTVFTLAIQESRRRTIQNIL